MGYANATLILGLLRILMSNVEFDGRNGSIEAYIVPPGDAHNSEYISASDDRRSFVSGFDGSAGIGLITKEGKCRLWTDGRYFTQALNQLDLNSWELMKEGIDVSMGSWLKGNLAVGSRVGVDPSLYSKGNWDALAEELTQKEIKLIPLKQNLVDQVWSDRPPRSTEQIIQLPIQFAGVSTKVKVEDVRKKMKDEGAKALIITELDQIAWLLNLRGGDVPYNPYFYAYVIVSDVKVEVFLNTAQISREIQTNITNELSGAIAFESYENDKLLERVVQMDSEFKEGEKIWVSKNCNFAIASKISDSKRITKLTPIAFMKIIKNGIEAEGMKKAHVKDAAALIQFLAFLDKQMENGENMTEISASNYLAQYRKNAIDNMGLSFQSIAGSGPNGAIIHYRPTPQTDRMLKKEEMFLLDSGGQFKDGTTDVTRTLHFGTPTDHQKECFTRVLKGQIAVKNAIFPSGIIGNYLDTLARKALWDVGLDYLHGTGHGIGMFLGVHEPPIGISFKPFPDDPGLQENMFLSNEPGYYEVGENGFGIRIENIVRVVKANPKHNFNNIGFLTFEDMTLVPIEKKLIQVDLLTAQELNYLNEYHSKVYKVVGDYMRELKVDEGTMEWLKAATDPIQTDDDTDSAAAISKTLFVLILTIYYIIY